VLEHLPIEIFFLTVKKFLKSNGNLLLTNMHSEMGNISQAGFVDEVSGEKIQGTSFAYTVKEVVRESEKQGFKCLGEMQVRSITDSDIEKGIVGQRGRKWIGVKVWFGCVLRGPSE